MSKKYSPFFRVAALAIAMTATPASAYAKDWSWLPVAGVFLNQWLNTPETPTQSQLPPSVPPSYNTTIIPGPVSQTAGQNYLKLKLPTDTVISSPYGERDLDDKGSAFHAGVDLNTPSGTSLASPVSGKVTWVDPACKWSSATWWNMRTSDQPMKPPGGCAVSVQQPDGTMISMMHLSTANVSVGQSINQGDTLGVSGGTGRSFGDHTHLAACTTDTSRNLAGVRPVDACSAAMGGKNIDPTTLMDPKDPLRIEEQKLSSARDEFVACKKAAPSKAGKEVCRQTYNKEQKDIKQEAVDAKRAAAMQNSKLYKPL